MSSRRVKCALARILAALEREIVDMPDEEIAAILDELGMRPAMRGSAAWADLLSFARRPEDKEERKSEDDERARPARRSGSRDESTGR
jgi:hypothetical protein